MAFASSANLAMHILFKFLLLNLYKDLISWLTVIAIVGKCHEVIVFVAVYDLIYVIMWCYGN